MPTGIQSFEISHVLVVLGQIDVVSVIGARVWDVKMREDARMAAGKEQMPVRNGI